MTPENFKIPSGKERRKSAAEEMPALDSEETERFVKKHGIIPLFTAAALSAFAVSHETPVEAKEVTPGMKWEEGFNALKDDVFTSPTEQAAYVVVLKDGTVYWVGSKQGTSDSVSQTADEILGRVRGEIVARSISTLCGFHTHPVPRLGDKDMKELDINEEEIKKALKKKKTTLSFPPSKPDINFRQPVRKEVKSAIEDIGGRTAYIVMDPSRVWKYRSATDIDYLPFPDIRKTVEDIREAFYEWDAHVQSRLRALSEDEIDDLETHISQIELDFFNMDKPKNKYTAKELLKHKREIIYSVLYYRNPVVSDLFFKNDARGKILQKRIDAFIERNKQDVHKWYDIMYNEWVPASSRGEPDAKLYQQLKEAYLRIGVVVESFTYEEAEKNPDIICSGWGR